MAGIPNICALLGMDDLKYQQSRCKSCNDGCSVVFELVYCLFLRISVLIWASELIRTTRQ